ncbi:rhomboid family intramembrane serine protease [Pokkaliibacter sp. CJK22405]|uniref:rhomboid family intramembrane serine protease n=1 Tax=Pokkaliibacter sp. CJK22405 TaxID=3384615 RepID=UPI0039851989
MLALQLVNTLTHYSLNQWGLVPRTLSGIPGILFSPWLHGSWQHCLGNLGGFAVLGSLVVLDSRREFIRASIWIILVEGALVWLFGRSAIHIGASGWLFGLWGLLLGRAWYRRSLKDWLLAAVTLFLYGGWIIGFVPQSGVSFESHIAGAIAGISYAAFAGKAQRT